MSYRLQLKPGKTCAAHVAPLAHIGPNELAHVAPSAHLGPNELAHVAPIAHLGKHVCTSYPV